MKLKGNHTIKYKKGRKVGEIVVEVQLKQIDELGTPRQNIWCGHAIVNEREYEHPDLPFCVNAQYMAEEIADLELQKLRKKSRTEVHVLNE